MYENYVSKFISRICHLPKIVVVGLKGESNEIIVEVLNMTANDIFQAYYFKILLDFIQKVLNYNVSLNNGTHRDHVHVDYAKLAALLSEVTKFYAYIFQKCVFNFNLIKSLS